jgi:glycosyltransferase involved in cell wall biosynthesis
MRVSVYVPCYNAAPYLAAVLEGIFAQTLRPDEILVVDDGSKDRTLEIAARFPVTVIRHERNRGLAAARNTAFRQARNELVAALDSDCVPQPDWLESLAAHLEDPKIAAAGGKLIEAVQESVADRWRAAHVWQHWGDEPVRNPRFMFGNNILLRKSVVLEVGGYDERLVTNGEDSNMSTRIGALGHDTYYEARAVVHHARRDTVGSILETYWRYRRDYYNPVTWPKLWRNFRYQYLGSARHEFQQDWRGGRFGLLWMDALMLLYLPYCDMRLLLSAAPAAPQKTQSSEV